MTYQWLVKAASLITSSLITLAPLSSDCFRMKSMSVQIEPKCEPTCWWGITPGRTSIMSTEDALRARGLISGTQKLVNLSNYGPYPDLTDSVHGIVADDLKGSQFVEVGMILSGTTVSEIGIDGRTGDLAQGNLNNFRRRWMDFAPEALVTKLGIPSSVWVLTDARGVEITQIPGRYAYDLWVAYDDFGVLVHYVGLSKITKRGQAYQICPTFANGNAAFGHIEIFLRAPLSQEATNLWLRRRIGIDVDPISKRTPIHPKMIEEAANLTISQFVKLVTASVKNGKAQCFETSVSNWPY